MIDKSMIRSTVHLHTALDTELVLESAPRSGDAGAPASICHDHAYMVVTGAAGATNQGPGDVAFDASPDAAVRFFVKSGSNNFEHAVLIRDLHHLGGDEVLQGFQFVAEEKSGIAPASATSVLPAQNVQQWFSFYQCDIAGEGTGSYCLVLELWDRDEGGQPRFAGHHHLHSRITVHFSPSSR